MKTTTLLLPTLLDWQRDVAEHATRFNVLSIGRRAGKTAFGQDRCAQAEVLQYPVAWFSPSYKYMIEVWREVTKRFEPIIKRQNAAERRIEFITGGVLEFWTMENKRPGMGRKYKRVIIDEAAFTPGLMEIWNYSIRPTLADYAGDAYILSTPKGRNAFWRLWSMGNDPMEPEWSCWQMPSEINPHIPREELVAMRRQLPERVAQQELDAAFIEDAGGVFRHVVEAAGAEWQKIRKKHHDYIIGVDWGQINDFTVFCVFDVGQRALVHMDRFNEIDYEIQKNRLMGLIHAFKPKQVIVESNSIGTPIIDSLRKENIPIVPFLTTNSTKANAIQALQLAFETRDIAILPDEVLIGELQAFEQDKTPSGLTKYSAPEGMHDDTVMALALGWQGLVRPVQHMVEQVAHASRWTKF